MKTIVLSPQEAWNQYHLNLRIIFSTPRIFQAFSFSLTILKGFFFPFYYFGFFLNHVGVQMSNFKFKFISESKLYIAIIRVRKCIWNCFTVLLTTCLFQKVLQNKYSQESDSELILKHALSGVEDLSFLSNQKALMNFLIFY